MRSLSLYAVNIRSLQSKGQMNSQSRTLRAAIIGYGESGRLSHAYGLQANPEFSIGAVCDLSPERRQQAKAELDCEAFDTHHQILERANEFELVSIVTRSDTHCELICECLDAGLHTLVTKPWVLNRSEADRVLAAQQSSGKLLFPWMPMYWSPEYQKIQSLIRSGEIGEVFLIRRYINQFWKRSDWQTESRYGGGYLLNWGMHIVQPILGLADSPAKRVFGQLQQAINPGDTEDNFMASIEFENGSRGIAEFTEAIEGLPSFMVQGTRGTILSNGESITLIQKDPGSSQPETRRSYPVEGKAFGDEADIYRDVSRAIVGDAPFKATPQLAYYGTIVIDAIRQSHDTRQIIKLDWSTNE